MTRSMPLATAFAIAILGTPPAAPALAQAQQPARAATAAAPRSAPISDVRYELTFDRATAASRTVKVSMTFEVTGTEPALLSVPAWTPGAYELSYFARQVYNFRAASGRTELRWDKLDYDTWRLRPTGPGTVTVSFDYRADTLDNAMAWAQPDFLLVNGTNVFPYAEGQSLDFPATVTVRTEPDWLVATGMRSAPGGAARTYRENNYHDLVDMPLFVGRFDLDSAQLAGKWVRLASYPAGQMAGQARERFWQDYRAIIPPMGRVFGETPWDSYTTLLIFNQQYQGGSALEHQSSHVGIYGPQFIGTSLLTNITAHEIFHSWNVKRLRPAAMVPYRYDVAQPTELLWVSEGFTNYYADLALARAGLVDAASFAELLMEHAQTVLQAPPVALEDASLSTWIHPTDGTGYVYYDKGGMAGFLLDVLIRDATDNRASLDDVMRALYESTYKRGRGFTTDELFAAASRAAAGRSFDDFRERYVDGREPYPWSEVLRLAGLRWVTEKLREPRLGISTVDDSTGSVVVVAIPTLPMAEAGAQTGDVVLRVGDLVIRDASSYAEFRRRYASREGSTLPVVVRRAGREVTLNVRVRLFEREEHRIELDEAAPPKARRILAGILRGATGP